LLSSNISKLDSMKLAKVVEIIQSRAPKASSQATETEIEIDLDKLDNVTLRQVEKFVKSATVVTKSKKNKSKNVSNISQNKDFITTTPIKNNEETESSEGESSSSGSDTDEEKKR